MPDRVDAADHLGAAEHLGVAEVLDAADPVDALILDLLEWVGPSPRPYDEVMDAWRTSCPRLPVWEEANDRGFLTRRHEPGRGQVIAVSPAGADHLLVQRAGHRA